MRIRRSCLGLALAASFAGAPAAATPEIPDFIAVQDVPPIPSTVMEELNRYQNIRLAAFQDWAPEGRQILIGTRFGDTNQIHRVEMPLGARYQLTLFDDRATGARTRPGHNQFPFSTAQVGVENSQRCLFDVATGKSERLTDGRARNVAAHRSRSGQILAWSGNARNGKDLDSRRKPIKTFSSASRRSF